jgi:hypothetical protein
MNQECPMPDCTQKTDIQQIKSDIQEIKTALLGNQFTDNVGFIKRQIELEKKVKALQFKMVYYSGAGAGAGFFVGYVLDKLLK